MGNRNMAKKETKAEQTRELKGQDLLRAIESEYARDDIPDFRVGDTVDVGVRIQEGDKKRVQVFSGVCIGRRGTGARQTFTVRRIVQSEGVERIFPMNCPSIAHIKVRRRGKVRRAKLNYLRGRSDRSARVKERFDTNKDDTAPRQERSAQP